MQSQFSRDARAVQLDGAFVDAEVCRDLFVHLAPDNMAEHLQFALAQGSKAAPQLAKPFALTSFLLCPSQRATHRRQEVLLWCALGQKVLRSPAHSMHCDGNVLLTRQKYHRNA